MIDRIKILPATESLLAGVVAGLKPDGIDYSSTIILFPGKRPAHVLRKMLAEQLQSGFIPPRIYTLERFIEYLYTDVLQLRTPRLDAADALSLLFDIHSTLPDKIGGEHYATLDTFVPVGIKLVAELEELAMAMLSERDLRDVMVNVPFTSFHALSVYYKKFYASVNAAGYVTRSGMYRTVAERIGEIELPGVSDLIMAGFFSFSKSEEHIVKDLLKREYSALVLQQGEGIERLVYKLTGTMPEKKEDDAPEPEIRYISAPDLHGEIFALAAELQNQLKQSGEINHRTAIALSSSEALFPLHHHALSLLDEDEYNIALGYPITRTPAFGFLVSLMELIESENEGTYSTAEYMKFFLHPYVKNIRFGKRADITRILVHTIEEYLAGQGTLYIAPSALERNDELFSHIERRIQRLDDTITAVQLQEHLREIHEHTVGKFQSFQTIGECMKRADEVLVYIFENSTANLHPYFKPYVERLLETLEGIGRSLLAAKSFSGKEGYFDLIRHFLDDETVPFSGTPLKGLQVLGLQEIRNLDFDTLYILDFNDDVVPGKPAADVLLPQQVRKRLGLETYRDRERFSEYYVRLAIAGAKKVFVMYCKSESGKKERSRFLEKLLWKQQEADGRTSALPYERVVKYRVHLANTRPEPIPKSDEMITRLRESFTFSASALDTLNACRLKFYYRYILRLEEKESADDDVDALIVGKMTHEILSEYFKPCLNTPLTADMLTEERLVSVVEKCFAKQFGEALPGSVMLFKQQALKHIRDFLFEYQLPLGKKEPITVTALERSIEIQKSGYRFSGRIDRIEQRGNRVYILDYKTGNNTKRFQLALEKLDRENPATWHEAIPSFQLPLYMLLYHELSGRAIESIVPAYVFLGKRILSTAIEKGIGEEGAQIRELYETVEAMMFKLIEELFDSNKEFTPATDLEKHCPSCPYHTLCGTQWTASYKVYQS